MEKKLKYLIPSVLLTAVIAGLVFINSGFYSISSDETSRTLIAYYWFKTGQIESTSWLPFHFLIIGSGFNIFNDLILLPRFITLFFGVLTLLSVGALSKELFDNKAVTSISIIIALLIPQRVILSVVPLSEMIFIFTIVSGAYFFLRWLKGNKSLFLISSAILILISAGLRYEGWVFAFILFLYALSGKIKMTVKMAVLVILAAFPAYWFASNYLMYGDFFYFLREPEIYFVKAQEVNLFNTIIFNPLSQFMEQSLITLSIIGIGGIYLNHKNVFIKEWLYVFFLPLILFSIVSIAGNALPAHNFWRTSAVWIFLLTPFTAYILHLIMKKLTFYRTGFIILLLFFIQLINSNFYYLKNVKQEYCLSEEELNTAKGVIDFMDSTAFKDDRVLIENVNTFEHFDILLASQDPSRFIVSERNNINPYFRNKYSPEEINYFLVRTDLLKMRLQKTSKYRKIYSLNGWILFTRDKMITQNRN